MRGRVDGCLVVVFLFALVLRVAATERFVGLDAEPDASSNPDQVDYEAFAAQMAEGKGYQPEGGPRTARRPPGTSFSLLPVYALLGRDWTAGRLWFNALSALSVLLGGLVAARFFGRTAGRWTAVALALYPGHFYYAMHFLSEPVFGLWTTAFCGLCVAALRAEGGRRAVALALGAGLSLGLCILIRPQALLILPLGGTLLLAALFLESRRGEGARLRPRPALMAAAVLSFTSLAVVAPWVVRNHHVVGKATISTIGGYTFWGANNEVIDAKPHRRGSWMPVDSLIDADSPVDGTEVEREAATWEYGKRFLREHPDRIPGLLGMKMVRLVSPWRDTPNRAVYWAFAIAWMAVAPLVLLGGVVAWRRNRGATVVLCLPLLAVVATALVFYGSTRFRDSVCVVLLTFAGVGLAAIQDRLRARKMGA